MVYIIDGAWSVGLPLVFEDGRRRKIDESPHVLQQYRILSLEEVGVHQPRIFSNIVLLVMKNDLLEMVSSGLMGSDKQKVVRISQSVLDSDPRILSNRIVL